MPLNILSRLVHVTVYYHPAPIDQSDIVHNCAKVVMVLVHLYHIGSTRSRCQKRAIANQRKISRASMRTQSGFVTFFSFFQHLLNGSQEKNRPNYRDGNKDIILQGFTRKKSKTEHTVRWKCIGPLELLLFIY